MHTVIDSEFHLKDPPGFLGPIVFTAGSTCGKAILSVGIRYTHERHGLTGGAVERDDIRALHKWLGEVIAAWEAAGPDPTDYRVI